MNVVLASSSTYRKAQLATLKIPFEYCSPDIDESAQLHEAADALAVRLAVLKAQAVGKRHPQALILGGDQTAYCEGTLLGKPGDYDHAKLQRQWLRGKKVVFYSALALLNTVDGALQTHMTETTAHYRLLSDAQIEYYLHHDQPFDCAGSFKSEALGIAILSSVTSNDPSALIGLPLIALTRMLHEAGLDILAEQP